MGWYGSGRSGGVVLDAEGGHEGARVGFGGERDLEVVVFEWGEGEAAFEAGVDHDPGGAVVVAAAVVAQLLEKLLAGSGAGLFEVVRGVREDLDLGAAGAVPECEVAAVVLGAGEARVRADLELVVGPVAPGRGFDVQQAGRLVSHTSRVRFW